jgi:hypothetical protein
MEVFSESLFQEEMKAKLFGVRRVNIQSQKTILNPLRHFGALGFRLLFGYWCLEIGAIFYP